MGEKKTENTHLNKKLLIKHQSLLKFVRKVNIFNKFDSFFYIKIHFSSYLLAHRFLTLIEFKIFSIFKVKILKIFLPIKCLVAF